MNQVRQVVDRYPADCRPTRIEPLFSAGGMSGAEFWRLESPRGPLALRRWPAEHPTPDGLRFIHTVLRHVDSKGFRIVPVPIAAADGATFVELGGFLWELEPWLPGVADYGQSPRMEKLRAAMRALAEFHVAAATFAGAPSLGQSPAVASRLVRLRELQSGGIDVLAQSIKDEVWSELAPLAREFLAALPSAVSGATAELVPFAGAALPLQPAIRDIWHDHVLFEGYAVTGIVDFGAMRIEAPAGDVARLLGSLVGDDDEGWREGLAAYAAIRPLSDHELAAVSAFDVSGTLLAGCNWIRWVYGEGRGFENRERIVERFRQIVTRLRNQVV
jgi:Ser/Thr protein kinase RdoA (MazF antagonist)